MQPIGASSNAANQTLSAEADCVWFAAITSVPPTLHVPFMSEDRVEEIQSSKGRMEMRIQSGPEHRHGATRFFRCLAFMATGVLITVATTRVEAAAPIGLIRQLGRRGRGKRCCDVGED